jgi:dTDP-4-dehydrorhamnose 3,5-epimerase-like enzyme
MLELEKISIWISAVPEKMKVEPLTKDEKKEWPAHGVVKLEKPFLDDRGSIQPLVDRLMKSAVLIESKAGSLRANHYHKTDWHYCYVVSGKIVYFHRPTGSDEEPESIIIEKGEIVFTPPMVDHGMKFPVDTVFLTLSRNPRDQASYEADVVRIEMLSTEGLKNWTPKKGDQ